MKIEHIAYNVSDPVAIADWYCKNLGFTVVKHIPGPHEVHFLADEDKSMIIEMYHNPPEQVPDYASMDPLILHVAFYSENPDADCKKLEEAGATLVGHTHLDDGSHLAMLRDPWGFSIQLCKRGTPLV